MQTHFLCAGYHLSFRHDPETYLRRLSSLVQKGMKKYDVKSVRVTTILMRRLKLITKEDMENYCKGRKNEKDSVNDDLESFFEDLRFGKEPLRSEERDWLPFVHQPWISTYFLPKFTDEELDLVKRRDPNYFHAFQQYSSYPDVREAESKFVLAKCLRRSSKCYGRTSKIENSSSRNNSIACVLQ